MTAIVLLVATLPIGFAFYAGFLDDSSDLVPTLEEALANVSHGVER